MFPSRSRCHCPYGAMSQNLTACSLLALRWPGDLGPDSIRREMTRSVERRIRSGHCDADFVDADVVCRKSETTSEKRSGRSQCGKCPLPSKISSRLAGIAACVA